MKTNNIRRFATILFLSLMMLPLLCQSCSGQAENKRTADSLFADSLRSKTKLKPLVQTKKTPMVSTSDENSDRVFVNYERMGYFPGGDEALKGFIHKNIQMPTEAVEAGFQCRVVVSFIVEKDGSTTGFKIVKSTTLDKNGDPIPNYSKLLKSCEKEALRVLKLMPKWIPSTIMGEPIRTKFQYPVVFDEKTMKKPPFHY